MSSNSRKTKKRRPGGQPGNQNARTHGFFATAFNAADRKLYIRALGEDPTDLTDAIAALRTKLHNLIDAEPSNVELIARAFGQLARLCATHFHLSQQDEDALTAAMSDVLADIERTLGPKGD